MPKNFVQESFRHHLLRALEKETAASSMNALPWQEVSQSLEVLHQPNGGFIARWSSPRRGEIIIQPATFSLYQRGDLPQKAKAENPEEKNHAAAKAILAQIASMTGLSLAPATTDERFHREEEFHDDWAASVRPEEVMVVPSFEACTAPEHRFILSLLGNLKGKKLLDLGCGLGEASVYFATQGAAVTASDLSSGMLEMASKVAAHHGVSLTTQHAAAEETRLPPESFDIVYAGNLLHHVEIAKVLDEARRVLKPGGIFVSWDPLQHNPLINVYRRLASSVRTPDEHPLRMKELSLFRSRFQNVQWKCFWFFTLAVFLRFYFWERVNPSKERYWKKILTDSPRLEKFYGRLEKWDTWLLNRFPALQRYCWNIVIWGRKSQ